MEREILFTGIGGQGIQLMAKVLAQAAADEGRHTMLFGLYGGAMRGGPSDSTVVIGDGPIEAPPIVPACWSIVAMHPSSLPALLPRLRSAGLLFANETLVQVTPSGGASVYNVAVSGITGNGTLGLNLVDDGSIRDLQGNPLQQNTPAAFGAQQIHARHIQAHHARRAQRGVGFGGIELRGPTRDDGAERGAEHGRHGDLHFAEEHGVKHSFS